jgi:hypothetical protein
MELRRNVEWNGWNAKWNAKYGMMEWNGYKM